MVKKLNRGKRIMVKVSRMDDNTEHQMMTPREYAKKAKIPSNCGCDEERTCLSCLERV